MRVCPALTGRPIRTVGKPPRSLLRGERLAHRNDPGSGLNHRKQGLQRLLDPVLKRQIRRLALTHKDRLLRFGAELVFALCELQGIKIVIIH